MKNTILIATIIMFSISKSYAQSPASNQQKKDTPSAERTPRKNTDLPPIKENNKKGQPSPAAEQQKMNPPAVTDRTPRTFNDQPPIKEVPKNYPPANRKSNLPKQNHRSKGNSAGKKNDSA